MTAVTASIDIAVPPQRVWEVIMDPEHFDDWVTIHRKLGHVDDGDLRPGFRVEQTLCLHRANFKVKWSLAEFDAAQDAGGTAEAFMDRFAALDPGPLTHLRAAYESDAEIVRFYPY